MRELDGKVLCGPSSSRLLLTRKWLPSLELSRIKLKLRRPKSLTRSKNKLLTVDLASEELQVTPPRRPMQSPRKLNPKKRR